MDPLTIPSFIDYVWMQDGEMSMQNIDWAGFWYLVDVKYRPAILMPAHNSFSSDYDKNFWYAFVTHFDNCDVWKDGNLGDLPPNHYSLLEAVEVENFEYCLPGFPRDVWTFLHTRFSQKLPDWGNFRSDCGHGQVWCGLVESEYLQFLPREKVPAVMRPYKPSEFLKSVLLMREG